MFRIQNTDYFYMIIKKECFIYKREYDKMELVMDGKLRRSSFLGRMYQLNFPGGGCLDLDLCSGMATLDKIVSSKVELIAHGRIRKINTCFCAKSKFFF